MLRLGLLLRCFAGELLRDGYELAPVCAEKTFELGIWKAGWRLPRAGNSVGWKRPGCLGEILYSWPL